jgi:hypothetical protein
VGERLTRRSFVLIGAGLAIGGCAARSSSIPKPATQRPASASGSPTAGPTGSPSAAPATRLPAVTRWQPNRNDVEPQVKLAAVRDIEARGNRPDAALQVIDAQYGGLLSDRASVLVVCRSWRSSPAGIRAGGSTYDVRLSRSGHGWRVTAIHPSHPGLPSRRRSSVALEVLGSPAIDLPPAGRRDVLSGRIHDSVLAAMLRLSRSYRIGVSVVRSGHPIYVFGTDRLSDHPLGRAFDTWRIDGAPIVDAGTPRRLVTGYMEAAAAAGSYNVGGPYLLGAAPQYFSDATHHDHVHAGFAT